MFAAVDEQRLGHPVLAVNRHSEEFSMDPLTARMRCLDLADSLCDEDADAAEIIDVASTLWNWVMLPFRLVDADEEDGAGETRQ
jgi:hypothetical protein